MATLYTIGYKGKSLRQFIGQLREAGVDAVIDIRLRNTSHLAGYTKKDALEFLLTEGFDIAYEHHPELAPTQEIFGAYKEEKDWTAYESQFLPLLEERSSLAAIRQIVEPYRAPCLLCAEPTADRCHRRLVAELWARNTPESTIDHL